MNVFKQLRNLLMPCATIFALTCFGNAFAQVSYQVTDLGVPKNDNYSMIMSVNDEGWSEIMAGNFLPGQGDSLSGVPLNGRALINVDGYYVDLGTLGGPNSWMNFGEINDFAQVVGDSETAVPDPNGEDICGLGTHLTCLPFLWQPFHMSALPTLGGNNGEASAINNLGQIVGMAENGAVDPSCQTGTVNNRVQLPVLWENGNAHALPTVDHDPDGFAFWINDHGQAVGYSGNCSGPIHGILWENRTASALADLGTGGFAENINNQGQIVGTVGSADGTTQTGAIWQIVKGTGTTKLTTVLGLLPGDVAGLAFGNNNQGQVVGGEWNANFYWSHAFIWQNGVMTDLNTLFPASSSLFATFAAKINNRGQIGGMAIVCSGPHQGEMHAFLATPVKQIAGESIAQAAPNCLETNFPAADAVNRLLRKSGPGGQFVR